MTGTSEAFITFTLATYTLLSVSRSNPDDERNPKKIAFAFEMFEKYDFSQKELTWPEHLPKHYFLCPYL